jgi:PAS domain S-box-containing protein
MKKNSEHSIKKNTAARNLKSGTGSTERKQAEEKLQKQAQIISQVHDAIVSADMDGHITTWNKGAEKIFGFTAQEAIGKHISLIHPPQQHGFLEKEVIAPLKKNGFHEMELKHRRKSGEDVYTHLSLSLLKNKEGAATGMIGYAIDITERKNYEEQIKSLARFPEENPSPVLRISGDGTIIYSNKPGEVLMDEWNRKVGQKIPENWHKLIANSLKSNRHMVEEINCGEKIFSIIVTPIVDAGYVNLYGRDITTLRRAQEALRKSHDKLETRVKERTIEITQIVDILRAEIEQREHAETVAKTERQKLNDVLETLPAYVILLSKDYHVPFANRTFRERFGESHGKRCYEYLFGRSEPCENCETYKVLKTNQPHHWEWTGPDGRNYDIYDFPFTDTDGSRLIMEMGIDITEKKRAEEGLRLASLYTRSLIEASLDPLVTISPEGKITDVNSATEEITGLRREQLIGSDFSDYFTEPDKAKEGYQRVISEGFVKDYPLTIRHTSGRLTDVLYNATVYKNEKGEEQGVFAAARDITERKAVEKRQNVTNSLLELFAKETSRKKYLDEAVKVIQGFSDCEFVGIRIRDNQGNIPYESYVGFDRDFLALENSLHLHRDNCVCIRAILENPARQEQKFMTAGGSFYCNDSKAFLSGLTGEQQKEYRGNCIRWGFQSIAVIPVRYRRQVMGAIHLADFQKNMAALSKIRFIESTASPLIGEAVYRFNTEAAFRDSKTRLVEAQRIARLGNWDWDIVNSSLWWSDEVYLIFGIEPGKFEVTYEAFLKFVHPQDRRSVQDAVDEALSNRKPYSIDHRIIRPDKTERIVHERAEVTFDDSGRAVRMIGTVQDVTEPKQAEEKIRYGRQKLKMLAAKLELVEEQERRRIAGDLHDSIGQILAFSTRELKFLQKSLPKNLAAPVQEIAGQLDKAVQQARTLSFDLSPSILYDIGFEVAVEDLAERFSQERNIPCSFENCHSSKPLAIPVKVLLYRSIRELLINAAKHSDAANIRVSLRRAGDDIHITVEDNGKGFEVSKLDDGAEKPKGFGIFSIRERLDHIGGRFEIESAKGKGTKATLIAPLNIEA